MLGLISKRRILKILDKKIKSLEDSSFIYGQDDPFAKDPKYKVASMALKGLRNEISHGH